MAELSIPEHVSSAVVDAWKAIPPCWPGDHSYCHVDCPYFYECYPPDYDDCDDFEDFCF